VNLLLGIAIGNAFGAGYDHLPPAEVARRFTFTRYDKAPHPQAKHRSGHYTGDTQMSLAVAEALLSGKQFTTDTLATSLRDAYHRDKKGRDYSDRTRSALEQPTVAGVQARGPSVTNGAALRAVPLGVLKDVHTVREYAVINAETTHHTPQAIVSSVAVALASHYFFYTHDPVDVFSFCLQHMQGLVNIPTKFFSTLAQMQALDASCLRRWDPNHGLDIDAIETAGVAIFLASRAVCPAELLSKAIRLGGDTDTVAGLALGLFAAYTSLESLPDWMFNFLENDDYGRDYLIKTGKRLATICPLTMDGSPTPEPHGLHQALDGRLEPAEPVFLQALMGQLMRQVPYAATATDLLVGIDVSGALLALAASTVTGLRWRRITEADITGGNNCLGEPGSPAAVAAAFPYGQQPSKRVIIVVDVITNGDTVCRLREALTKRGWSVLGVVAPLVSDKAYNQLDKQGIRPVFHTKYNDSKDSL